MPLIADPYPASWPPWLKSILNTVAVNPVMTAVPTGNFRGMAPLGEEVGQAVEPELKSIGKKVSDLLGSVFTTKEGSGLPPKMTLSNWDARAGNLQFHGGNTPFEATPQMLDQLISSGQVNLEQPAATTTTAVQSAIRKMLDANMQEYKDAAFTKAIRKPYTPK